MNHIMIVIRDNEMFMDQSYHDLDVVQKAGVIEALQDLVAQLSHELEEEETTAAIILRLIHKHRQAQREERWPTK